jgi:Fe2+ transport system protein FeoA
LTRADRSRNFEIGFQFHETAEATEVHEKKSTLTLATLPVGTPAIVERVTGARQVTRRLLEMGLLPGTEVRVVRAAPLGDPIELSLRGYALSIRKADALGIEVAPAPVAR